MSLSGINAFKQAGAAALSSHESYEKRVASEMSANRGILNNLLETASGLEDEHAKVVTNV